MLYKTTFTIHASQEDVFAAIHEYKLRRKPDEFFSLLYLERLVKMDFEVLTEHTLGLGATYHWKFSIFGLPILVFQERIVDWIPHRTVAYQAVTGWSMYFKIDLDSDSDETLVNVQIDISTGWSSADRLARPFIEWGLRQATRNLVKKGLKEIGQRRYSPALRD